MIKIALNGAQGKMGTAITNLISNSHSTKLYKNEFTITQDVDFAVMIDFSAPNGTIEILDKCLELKKPIVIGTTGLSGEQLNKIQQAAKTIPVLYAANTSLGVNLLYKAVADIAKSLDSQDCQIGITDVHHKHKKDSPSGTALAIGDKIVSSSKFSNEQLQYNAIRGGEVFGQHEVKFLLAGEEIVVSHQAYNRDIFAKGALAAAKFLHDKPAGFYTMQDVL